MPGLAANCNNFYKVVSGDGCYSIEQAYGITQDQFLEWNTAVDDNCTNIWVDYYVCVGV